MDQATNSKTGSRRRRVGLIALLAGSALLTLGSSISTLAVFTDSKTATGSFSAGTVSLTLSPTTVFTAAAVFPGDAGTQTVAVTNSGTGTLRYAVTTSATNADGLGLAGQLQLTIATGACPVSGTVLYGPAALGSAAFGNPATGNQSGDRVLAGGASENLCFAWSLPSGTGNAFQGAATTATFTFASEQTANNP
ncbi:MAG: hypothetical protein HY264_03655 [Chloroflexi bacterium]|nr:hypothetical protein [Chloroflexota bacterium]